MRHLRIAFLPLLLLALAPVARPQEAGEDVEIGRPWSVSDSGKVLSLTREVEKDTAAGQLDQAAISLQRILDFHANEVVQVGPARDEHFIGARLWVHRFLRSTSEEGRAAYRRVAGPEARRLLARATETRREKLLLAVIRRFYLTGTGPDALRALSTLLLTQGRYLDAAHYLGLLADDFPEATSLTDLARRVFALAKAGDGAGMDRLLADRPDLLSSEAPIRVGDGQVPLRAFVSPLVEEARRRAETARPDGSAWTLYGGSPARDLPAPSISGLGPVQWSSPTGYRDRDDDVEAFDFHWNSSSSELLDDHFPIFPVVDQGVVYFTNGYAVHALNLYTGKHLWSFKGPWAITMGKTNPGTVYAPAVANGTVYANLEVRAPYVDERAREYASHTVIYYIPQRRLFAIEAATGKVLWSHEDHQVTSKEDRAVLADLNVSSAPLVVDGTIYVTASRQVSRYFCYLLAVDAATGKILWHTPLCTGQQELNLFGRPIKELAGGAVSERDGVLYCSTNLGAVMALDRRSGEILWVRGYPQTPIPFSYKWYTTEERRTTWTNAPPIVTEDTVYFTPTDGWDIIALDRRDGHLLFRFPDGEDGWLDDEPRYMIGVSGENVYAAGEGVLAINRRSGKLVWSRIRGRGRFQQGTNGDREEARGRGLVTPEAVYTVTQAGLYAFDPRTGERLSFEPLAHETRRSRRSEAGGNLVVAGHVLLVAGRDDIYAYYLWERIYDDLKKQAESDPEDPFLALEIGEVYSQGRRLEEAERSFTRALRLAARLGAVERKQVEKAARKGLFTVQMRQGAKAWEDGNRGTAARCYRAALEAAVDPQGRIRAMLALGDYYRYSGKNRDLAKLYLRIEKEHGDVVYPFEAEGSLPAGLHALMNLAELMLDEAEPAKAIGHLSRIIARYPGHELLTNVESQVFARQRIDRIIAEYGRDVYMKEEREARALLDRAVADGSTDDLEEVTRLYPNSHAVQDASVALGKLLLTRGDYRRACTVLRRILSEFPDSPAAPTVLHLLASALEKRGFLVSAKSALARLARRYPDSVIETEDGEVAAGVYANRRLLEAQFQAVATEEVRLSLPLERLWLLDEGESSYVRVLEADGIRPPGFEGNLLLGTNGVLRAVDSRTKHDLWQREMNGLITKPAFADGLLVLVNTSSITAVTPDTGQKRWSIPNEASVRAVRAMPGTVYVLTADYRNSTDITLRAIAPRTGKVVWTRELPDHQVYDALLLTEETVSVAARQPAGVTVLDAATGRLRFRVEMAPRTLFREPFLVDDDKLFVVHSNNRVELYDTSTGRRLWETTLPEDRYFRSAIPVAGGIFVTDTQEHLLFLEAATGEIRWTVPPVRQAPLNYQGEAADSERVFVVRRRKADDMYQAEARDLRTGELLWRENLLVSKSATPAPLLSDRYAIFHVNSYDFGQNAWVSSSILLDKESGRKEQEITPDELQGFFTYPFLAEGLFALNARGRVVVYGQR